MGLSELLNFAVIGLYIVSTLFFLAGVLSRRAPLRKIGAFAAGGAFALHTGVLVLHFTSGPIATLPTEFYLMLLSWSVLATSALLWWKFKIDFLALTASPLALLLFLSSLTMGDVQAKLPPSLAGPFFALHIGSLFVTFALLAMAFGAGLIFLHLNRKIKTKEKLEGFRQDLPSLATFDKVNHWTVTVGFPLFTIGLISGFIWAQFTWDKVISWDPKEIVSVCIWFLFAFLFHQRLVLGWKGRKPAVLAIWLFLFTVTSLVGINLFLPTHHSFNP